VIMESINTAPCILLVGKTNVGKSTLFNRLANKKISIAHSTPGATRDCIIRDTDFNGHPIVVIDSGGLSEELYEESPFQAMVARRVEEYINHKADLILFVVSAKDGISRDDHKIAEILHKSGRPVLLVINKIDDESHEMKISDCMAFGFADWVMVSAAQKNGLHELKEKVLEKLPKPCAETAAGMMRLLSQSVGDNEPQVRIAIIGRPNSGKSTYVNTLLNEDRVLTSEIPGTTVDAVDTEFSYQGKDITLIDTAGIRRQRSICEEVEKMAVARTLCALDRADVTIMMVSAIDGITEQDQKIAGMIFEKKKAAVLVVNKWDEDILDETTKEKFMEKIRFELPFLHYIPILFMSAKYGRSVFKPIDCALRLAARYKQKINTSKLNRSLEKAQIGHPPPIYMGRRLKMFFATQIDSAPPTFAISCSKPDGFHFSYQRYLTNFFREDLGLNEIPLRVFFRSKAAFDGSSDKKKEHDL
jgi:GTP-binding protein